MRVLVWIVLALFASPLLPLALWSCTAAWPWPHLLPPSWSARAWGLSQDPDAGFMAALATSCGIAAAVTALAFVLSLPLGELLGRRQFRGKGWLEVLVVAPVLLPSFVSAMGLHETLLRWGIAGSLSGVILLHLVPSMPYMVRSLSTGYALLGTRLEDQARSLGASPRHVLLHVTLPRLGPAILVGGTFVFLVSFGEYLLTVLVGGGDVVTLPVVLYPFIAAGDRPVAAMGSLLMALPPLVAVLGVSALTRKVGP